MLKPRKAKIQFFSAAVLSAAFSITILQSDIRAQQSAVPDERARGISLYQQGNEQEAIETLQRFVKQHKDDVRAWHYLGLALNHQGKPGDARKAHEKAAKNGERLLISSFSVKPESEFSNFISQFKAELYEAADSADKYLELSSKPSKKKLAEWHDRADLLRDFIWQAGAQDKSGAPAIFSTKEVTTKAHILSRPEPQYTEEARKNQVTGTVVLRAVFAADGQVRAIRPIRMLPDGLTINAIRAARQIKFIPATRDGQPVSQYIQIEYNFNLY
jgi:TonB family protein